MLLKFILVFLAGIFVENWSTNKDARPLKFATELGGKVANHLWAIPDRVAGKHLHHVASSTA